MFDYFFKGVLEFLDEIGCCDCCASTDTCHAMDKNIGLFSCSFDEVISSAEVLAEVIGFVVISRQIEIKLDFLFAEGKLSSSSDGENGSNTIF